MIIETLQILTSLFLGILVGSLLLEAMVFVPIWKKMDPKLFLDQHTDMSPIIYAYFNPITILGTLTPIVTGIYIFLLEDNFAWLQLVPGIVGLTLLLIYYIYFKAANQSFFDGSVGIDGLSKELMRWGNWHWLRTILGIFGFIISLIILNS